MTSRENGQALGLPPMALAAGLTGLDKNNLRLSDLEAARRENSALVLTPRERLVQQDEIYIIKRTADLIQEEFLRRELSLPIIHSIKPPEFPFPL